jgi:hypothetical protein
MEPVCHRCGGTVQESGAFCPHCGAPQLRYEAPEETAPASAAPAQRFTVHSPDSVHWRAAIRAAAIIAVPAGLLSSRLGLQAIWAVWLIVGGITVISLYRRSTTTLPTGRMGWRIGVVLGLFTAVIANVVDGVSLVVQRFALHQGAALDQTYHQAVQLSSKMYLDLFASSNPEMAAAIAKAQQFWFTPSGAAAMILINAAGMAFFMLIFAAAGGALGARLTARSAQTTTR